MKRVLISACVASLAFTAVISSVSAGVVWDESTNGNLSNNRMAPTPIALGVGSNTIRGSLTGNFGDGKYYDYVTFDIPSGLVMMAAKLDALTNATSGTTIVGIAAGGTFPSDANGSNANLMLGWTGLRPSYVGNDFLPSMAIANNGNVGNSGFSIPLQAGKYSFWIQDYDTPASYQISFVLEAAVAPIIAVTGKKVTSKGVVLSGSASGTGTTVSYRVGGKGAFKHAKGAASAWKIVASNLKKGRNVVTIRATGLFGTSTKNVTIVKK